MIFAVDLAARASGWVVLDIAEQPYRVVAHGVVKVKGAWGPSAWVKAQQEWNDCLEDELRPGGFGCIAYEVAGWAGQSGNSKSGHGTSRNTRRMLDQAEALFGAIAIAYTRRLMAVDQAAVKLAIHGSRTAKKSDVAWALELRRLAGEFTTPASAEFTWGAHELDALAIALYAAVLLKQEVMA